MRRIYFTSKYFLFMVLFSLIVVHYPTHSAHAYKTTDPFCTQTLDGWQLMAPAPAVHMEGASAVVNDKLYVFTGFADNLLNVGDRVDVYNPATNIWESQVSPLNPMPIAASHIQGAADGRHVWTAGGFLNSGFATDEVWRYDTRTDTWVAGPPLPAPRASGALVRQGRRLHYISGLQTDRNTDMPDHWVLNLNRPINQATWKPAAPLPSPRNHFQAVTIDGLIYAVGGQFGHDLGFTDVDLVHAYDPASDTWTAKANLPTTRSHAEPATFVMNDRIIVIAGRSFPGVGLTLDQVSEYNPQTDSWNQLTAIPTPLIGASAGVVGQQMIVTDGGTAFNVSQQDTWVTDVTTDCIVASNRPNNNDDEPSGDQTIASAASAPQIGIFDPGLSKIGFLQPGTPGVTGEQIEWIVTVRNNGDGAGTNIVVRDTLRPELRVDRVEINRGSSSINGQTVTVTIPALAPNEAVIFSIFTTVLSGTVIDNTVCMTADHVGEICDSGLAVNVLPRTGETPIWRLPLLMGAVLLAGMLGVRFGWLLYRR